MIMQETIAIFLIILSLQNAYGLERTVNQEPGLVAEDDDENPVARDKYPDSIKDDHESKEEWPAPDGHNEASPRSSSMEKGLHHDVDAKDVPGREVEGEITITDPEGERDTNPASVENGSIEKDGKLEQPQYGDSEMEKGNKRGNEPSNRDDVVDEHDDRSVEGQDGAGMRRQQSEESHSKEGISRAIHDSDLGKRLNEEDEQISAVDHDLTTTDKVELEPPHIDDFQEESHSAGETRSADYSSMHGQGTAESTGTKLSKSSYADDNDVKKSEQGRERTGFDDRPNSSNSPHDEFRGKESFSKKEEMYAGSRGDSDSSMHQRGDGYESKERSKPRYDGVQDRTSIHHLRHQYEPRKFHEREPYVSHVEKSVDRLPGKPGRGERYDKRGKYEPQQKDGEDYDGDIGQRVYGKERESPAEGRSKLSGNDGRSWTSEQQTDESKEQSKKEKSSEHGLVYSDNEAKDGHQDFQGSYKTRTNEGMRGSSTSTAYPPHEDSRGRSSQRDSRKRPAYERRKNAEHGRYGHAHYNGKQETLRRKKQREYASPTKLFDLAENDVIKATQGNDLDALSDVKDDGLKLELENESLQTEVQTLQDEDQNVKDVLKGAEEYEEKEKSGPLATRDEMNGPYGESDNRSPDSTDDIKTLLEHQEDQDPYGYFSSPHKSSEDDETGEKKQIVTRANGDKKTPQSLKNAIKTTINQLLNKDILTDPFIANDQAATEKDRSGHAGAQRVPAVSKLDLETKRRQVQELLMKFFSDRNRTREFIRCAMQHRCEGLRQLGRKTSARVLNDSFVVNSDDEGSINLTKVTTKRNNDSMNYDSANEPQSTEAVNENSPEKVYTAFNVTNTFNTILGKNESKIFHEVVADNKTINKSQGEDALKHKQHLWEATPEDSKTKDIVISSNLSQPMMDAPKASFNLHPFIQGTGKEKLESNPSTNTDNALQLESGKSQNVSTLEEKSTNNTGTTENGTKASLNEAIGNENVTQPISDIKNQSMSTESKVVDGGINNGEPERKNPLASNDSSLFSNDSDAINTSKKDKSPPVELVDEEDQTGDLDSGKDAVLAQPPIKYNATGSNESDVTSNETQDIGPYQSLRGTLRATVPRAIASKKKNFNEHEIKIIRKMYHHLKRPKHQYKLGTAFKRTIPSTSKVLTKRTMHHRGWHRHKEARNPYTRSGSKKDDLPEGLTGAISYTNRDGREFIYAVGTEQLTWGESRVKCQSHGGDLISIGDKEEQEFVTTNVIAEDDHYWIGFTDQVREGQWEWSDGTPNRYSNWSNLEPDDGTMKTGEISHNEDCAVMNPRFDWSDVPCWNRFRYICKIYPGCGHAISFGGQLSYTDVGNGTSQDFTIKNHRFNGKKPKECTSNSPLTPPIPGAYPQPSAYPLSTAGNALPPPAAAPQPQMGPLAVQRPNSNPSPYAIPSQPPIQMDFQHPVGPLNPVHILYPQDLPEIVEPPNPLSRSPIKDVAGKTHSAEEVHHLDSHIDSVTHPKVEQHGPQIVQPPPPVPPPPPPPPPPVPQPPMIPPMQPPPPPPPHVVVQPSQVATDDKAYSPPYAPFPPSQSVGPSTFTQPAAHALPSPNLEHAMNAADLNAKTASEGTLKEGGIGVGSSGKEGARAPISEGTSVKLGGTPFYGKEVENVSPGGNGGPSSIASVMPPSVIPPYPPPPPPIPPPPPPPIMLPYNDVHVHHDHYVHEEPHDHYIHEPHREHPTPLMATDDGKEEHHIKETPSDIEHFAKEGPPMSSEKPDSDHPEEKISEEEHLLETEHHALAEHLSPEQKIAMANSLAAEIAPELVKDYSVRFAPDIDVVKSICGRMCGDTAGSICMGNPQQVGIVCGRLCAETLLKMSPVEVLNVMSGMRSLNAVSSKLATENSDTFCQPHVADTAAKVGALHAANAIGGPQLTAHPSALADAHTTLINNLEPGFGSHSGGALTDLQTTAFLGASPTHTHSLMDDNTAALLGAHAAYQQMAAMAGHVHEPPTTHFGSSIMDHLLETPVGHLGPIKPDHPFEPSHLGPVKLDHEFGPVSLHTPISHMDLHLDDPEMTTVSVHPHHHTSAIEHHHPLSHTFDLFNDCPSCHHHQSAHKVVSFVNKGDHQPLSVQTDLLSGTYRALVNSIEPEVISSLVSTMSLSPSSVLEAETQNQIPILASRSTHKKKFTTKKKGGTSSKKLLREDNDAREDTREPQKAHAKILETDKGEFEGSGDEKLGTEKGKANPEKLKHDSKSQVGNTKLKFDEDVDEEDQDSIIQALQQAAVKQDTKFKKKENKKTETKRPEKSKAAVISKVEGKATEGVTKFVDHERPKDSKGTEKQEPINTPGHHDFSLYQANKEYSLGSNTNKPTDNDLYLKAHSNHALINPMQSEFSDLMGGGDTILSKFAERDQPDQDEIMALTRLPPKKTDGGPMSLGYVSAFQTIADEFTKRATTPRNGSHSFRKLRPAKPQATRTESAYKRRVGKIANPRHSHRPKRKQTIGRTTSSRGAVRKPQNHWKRNMILYPSRKPPRRFKMETSSDEDIMTETHPLEITRREEIDSTSSVIPIKITIKSVGCFDPPFHGSQCEDNVGSIIVNGAERSPGQQGFNFVIVDFKTGEVEKGISFNTHGDAGAHKKMSKLIESLGDWKVVAVAVKEDGKNYLPSSALEDMRKIGAKDLINNDLEYRAAYALVGFSGPSDVRDKLPWIREEVSKAGKGPSVISVSFNAGMGPYKDYGGVVEDPKVGGTDGDNQSQPENSNKPASEETAQNRNTKARPTESQNTDAEYTGIGPNGSTEQTVFSKGVSEQTQQLPQGATGSVTGSQVAGLGQQINNPAIVPSGLPQVQPTESTLTQAESQPSYISPAIASPAFAVARPGQQPQQQFFPQQGLSLPSVGVAPSNLGQQPLTSFVNSQIPGQFANPVSPQQSLPSSMGLNDLPKTATLSPQALTTGAQSASITSQNQQLPQAGLAEPLQPPALSGASFTPQQISADNAAKSLSPLSPNIPSVQSSKQQNTPSTSQAQTSPNMVTSLPINATLTGAQPQLPAQPKTQQQLLPASTTSMDGSAIANVSLAQSGVQSLTPAPPGQQQGDPSVSQKINALMYNISTLQKMIEKNAATQTSGQNSAVTNESNIKTVSAQTTESGTGTSQDTTSQLPSASSLSENVKAAWKTSKINNQQLNDNSLKALLGNVSGDSQSVEAEKTLLMAHSPFADLTDAQNMELQQQGIISHFSNPAPVSGNDPMGLSGNSNNYANAVQALTSQLDARHDMGKSGALTDTPESNVNKLVALADALGYGKDATNPETPGGVTALNKLLAIADALGMSAASTVEKAPSKPAVPSLYNTVPSKLMKGPVLKEANAKPLSSAAKLVTENRHLKGSTEPTSDSGLQSALDELSRANEEANDNYHESNAPPTSELAPTGEEGADPRTDDADATVEGQITTALSTLGIPDAAASGIASLMSPTILSNKKDKKDNGQKLGLAAKLAKSIADLGGRGAASAAGVASLSELLMNAADVSVSQATDKLGQALQKVGGAGAAVGYAALASALKDPASSANAGALVGNLIMALAEQGSAPGTAGLAAFAAGLGGSGADALAGGLGGSLENIPAAESAKVAPTNADAGNMFGANDKDQPAGTPPDTSVGVKTNKPTAANSPSPTKSQDDKATLEGLGGEVEVHTQNTDSEYTGQGPIGSREQGGFYEIGLGTGKNNPLAKLAASILQNAQVGSGRTKTDDSTPAKNCNQQDALCHDGDKEKGIAALGNTDRSTEAEQEEPAKPHGSDPLKLFSTADLGLIGNSLGSVLPLSPKKEAFKEDKFSRRCTARCKDQTKQVGLLIELKSTSKSATIKVNERDLSKDEPGFNIVVIDFSTGEVEATENFDTENDGGASKAMANFLVSLRPGKIILVASKGDASNNMEPSAYDALNNCGGHILKTSLLQKGDKYVLLGFKGPDVDWTREVLAEAGGGTALLSMPLMIGPAALKNESLCLQICKHNEESGVLLPQGQENFSEEDTYADIGSSRKAMGGSDIALKRNQQVEGVAPMGNGAEVSGYSKFVVLPVRGKHRDYQPDETEQEISDALDPDDMNEQLDQKVQALEREKQKAQRLNKDTKPLKKQRQKHKTGQKKKIISKLKNKPSSTPGKEEAVSSSKVKPTKKVKSEKAISESEVPQILNASVIDFSEFDKVLQGYSKDNPLAAKAILLNYDIGTGTLNPKAIGFPPNEGLDFPTGGHKSEDSHTPGPQSSPTEVSPSTKFAGGEIVKIQNESSSNVSHQVEPNKSWTTVSDSKNDKNKKGNSSEGASSLGAVFKNKKKESDEEKLKDINEKSYSEIGDLLYSRSDQPRPLQIQVVEPRSKITDAFHQRHLHRRKNLRRRKKKS